MKEHKNPENILSEICAQWRTDPVEVKVNGVTFRVKRVLSHQEVVHFIGVFAKHYADLSRDTLSDQICDRENYFLRFATIFHYTDLPLTGQTDPEIMEQITYYDPLYDALVGCNGERGLINLAQYNDICQIVRRIVKDIKNI